MGALHAQLGRELPEGWAEALFHSAGHNPVPGKEWKEEKMDGWTNGWREGGMDGQTGGRKEETKEGGVRK